MTGLVIVEKVLLLGQGRSLLLVLATFTTLAGGKLAVILMKVELITLLLLIDKVMSLVVLITRILA